jgi:hypothetical protein
LATDSNQSKTLRKTLYFHSFTSTASVYRQVAILLIAGKRKAEIARDLRMSKQNVQNYASRLESSRIIERGPRTSFLPYKEGKNFQEFIQSKTQVKDFEEGVPQPPSFFKPNVRIHDHRFVIPIKEEAPPPAGFWQFSKGKRRYRFHLSKSQGKITIENSGGNIKIYIQEKELPMRPSFRKESKLATEKTLLEVIELLHEAGLNLRISELQEVHLHSASEMDKGKGAIDPKKTTEMELGRNAEGDLQEIPTEAKAWIDRSKGQPELETNDLAYQEKLVMMPEFVCQIAEQMKQNSDFAKNIELHLQVERETKDALKELRAAINQLYAKVKEKGE